MKQCQCRSWCISAVVCARWCYCWLNVCSQVVKDVMWLRVCEDGGHWTWLWHHPPRLLLLLLLMTMMLQSAVTSVVNQRSVCKYFSLISTCIQPWAWTSGSFDLQLNCPCSSDSNVVPKVIIIIINLLLLLRRGRGVVYCDQPVCVCLSVREHISGTSGPIFTKFCVPTADPLWPWLVPAPAALCYVMYFRFYGWHHVWL